MDIPWKLSDLQNKALLACKSAIFCKRNYHLREEKDSYYCESCFQGFVQMKVQYDEWNKKALVNILTDEWV